MEVNPFESAGYSNAFDVRILPDSADPMDIRQHDRLGCIVPHVAGVTEHLLFQSHVQEKSLKEKVSLRSLRIRRIISSLDYYRLMKQAFRQMIKCYRQH